VEPGACDWKPSHITVIYQDEAPDAVLLADRLRVVAGRTRPFRLKFGSVMRFPEPVRGAFVAVTDPLLFVPAVHLVTSSHEKTLDRFFCCFFGFSWPLRR
jgi:hypothetical protein